MIKNSFKFIKVNFEFKSLTIFGVIAIPTKLEFSKLYANNSFPLSLLYNEFIATLYLIVPCYSIYWTLATLIHRI